jgi:hypothetical protein
MEESKLKKIVTWMCRKAVNTRTHRNKNTIQRNENCYCGEGTWHTKAPSHNGRRVKRAKWDDEKLKWFLPNKFKDCCFSKHAVLSSGTMTPAMADFVKRQDRYFKKQQEEKYGQRKSI